LPLDRAESAATARRRSPATERAYQRDWADFTAWCETRRLQPLPAEPDTIVDYLEDQLALGHKPATIARRAAAIGALHGDAGHINPCTAAEVRATLQAIKARGSEPRPIAPLTVDELRRMVTTCNPATLIGARDAALLLVGFAGGYSRSELVAIDVDDLDRTPGGDLTIAGDTPRRLAAGSQPLTCPIRALDHWLDLARIDSGPVFRPISRQNTVIPSRLSDRGVARVVARTAERAGLPPNRHFAAHSLRAGFIHAALAAGVPERAIAHHTGLAPAGSALTGYARRTGKSTPTGPIDVGL